MTQGPTPCSRLKMQAVGRTEGETFWEKYLPPLWPPIWPPLWPPVWRPLPVTENGRVQLHTQRLPSTDAEPRTTTVHDADLVELGESASLAEGLLGLDNSWGCEHSYRRLAGWWNAVVDTELIRYTTALCWEQWRAERNL